MLLFLAILFSPLWAKPTHFDLRDVGSRNLIYFVSDAPIEKTLGSTSTLTGWVELDPEKVGDVKGEIEVDVRTFHTEIEQKNQLLREKILNTAEYPIATFSPTKIVSVTRSKLASNAASDIKLEGVLKWHGLAKTIIVSLKAYYFPQSELSKQRMPGNLLKVSGQFDIDLSGFGTSIPDNMTGRFGRIGTVSFDFVGTDQLPVFSLAPEPPKPKERQD